MKFGVDLTPEWQGSRVLDANGMEIDDVVEGDTKTGEVVCLVRNSVGEIQFDWDKGVALRFCDRRPAPLLLVKINPGKRY